MKFEKQGAADFAKRKKYRSENMQYKNNYESPLGKMIMAADEKGLCGLWFANPKYGAPNETLQEKDLPVFADTRRWLDEYFAGKKPDIELPIHLVGTEFQLRVWKILCGIPYGKTMTYGEIAKILAKQLGFERMSAQAVGGAVGRNNIAIIVPCHRVVGANGNLTGYAAGLDKKIALLKLEHAFESDFYLPEAKK